MAGVSTPPTGLTLVIGGARSGKSAYAVEQAARLGKPVLYVATAQAIDPEMRAKIRRHQRSRPRGWRTLDEPLEPARRIDALARSGSTVVLDCLTVWLGNLLEHHIADADRPRQREVGQARRRVLEELRLLCRLPKKHRLRLIVITNEVGAGLVPPYPLGRIYRDLLGEANQFVAKRADNVVLLVAGRPVDLTALAAQRSDE